MEAIFTGNILSPISKTRLLFLSPGYIVISDKGKILEISQYNPKNKYKNFSFYDFSGKLICPGFIDIHNHLAQFHLCGLYEGNLFNWLENLIYPCEDSFKSEELAKKSTKVFFKKLLKNGTTCTSTYVTIHKQATDIAFQSAKNCGIRAFIGNVLMDQQCPINFRSEVRKQLKNSKELIEKWDRYDNNRLRYVLTPRFAVSCSFDLLKGVGNLAKKYDVYIQTHLAENRTELKLIKKLFPEFESYTEIYYKAGILSDKTILAHCIYLTEKEIDILHKTGSKICHCPTSNRFLASGIMPYRKYKENGLCIGLGTDVAGGYSLSMLNEMKEAIESSKIINLVIQKKEYELMTVEEAFYLATLGGAKALSMENKIGSLEKGKSADFLVIDYHKLNEFKDSDLHKNPKTILSKIIYCGSEQIIEQVYIRGKRVV